MDPDRGQTETLRYELVNKNAGGLPFRLESCSGQLAVRWDKLDYEGTNQYPFGVRVVDSGYPVALDAQVQVVVDILNVNEAPQFAESGSLIILENAPTGVVFMIRSTVGQAAPQKTHKNIKVRAKRTWLQFFDAASSLVLETSSM
ncbi:Cadherin domain [Phytophthora infestans]|uniref:Cadherin domain n=1 Tax=Phytophthora infestans TaxID=4787 RepID=A0A833SP36_PHYIN|nr:Cadherin domain [Phytophthora infestans]